MFPFIALVYSKRSANNLGTGPIETTDDKPSNVVMGEFAVFRTQPF